MHLGHAISLRVGVALLALAAMLADTGSATAATVGASQPGPIKVAVRRITESQYRHTIADIFGSDIKINSRFEPERRDDGLLAVGNADLSLTSAGFEQYFALASSIATQALSDKLAAATVPCKPANP